MLIKIFMVPVIMGCALVGTVGLIKGIKRFCPEQFGKEKKSFDTDLQKKSE